MTLRRSWPTALFASILAMAMLFVAGPVQAGEACANSKRPLVLPTPKSLGLGSGWRAIEGVGKSLRPVNPKKCRTATDCVAVIWKEPKSGVELHVSASQVSRKSGQALARVIRQAFSSPSSNSKIVKRGKLVTFADQDKIRSLHDSTAITFYNYQRMASLALWGKRQALRKYSKKLPQSALIKKTQQMALPCAGRMTKFKGIGPL